MYNCFNQNHLTNATDRVCAFQEDTRKALLASLQDDPLNPWVKDISSGRNPGIPALLDWPEASDESDSEVSPMQIEGASLSAPLGNDVDLSQVSLEIPGFAGFGRCWQFLISLF